MQYLLPILVRSDSNDISANASTQLPDVIYKLFELEKVPKTPEEANALSKKLEKQLQEEDAKKYTPCKVICVPVSGFAA